MTVTMETTHTHPPTWLPDDVFGVIKEFAGISGVRIPWADWHKLSFIRLVEFLILHFDGYADRPCYQADEDADDWHDGVGPQHTKDDVARWIRTGGMTTRHRRKLVKFMKSKKNQEKDIRMLKAGLEGILDSDDQWKRFVIYGII